MSALAAVIVGTGEAGVRTALALREHGWAGPITLIGEEPHAPYERPPLSKAVLLAGPDTPPPPIADAGLLAGHAITPLFGVTVTAIEWRTRTLALSDGGTLPYDRLVLATGCRPRRLPMAGAHYLRTLGDAWALRRQFRPGRRLVVIGAGFIGLEVAASAREHGMAVTLIAGASRVLARGVPAVLAERIADRHRAAGVDLRFGVSVTAMADGTVTLSDGTTLAADTIAAGIGAVPNTDLAQGAGLKIDNGIAVDETLRTSDPAIFAVGDCASFPHPLYGGERVRLEAWRNARDQGVHAARSLLGGTEPYQAVPWLWSDQYDLHLQVAGIIGNHTVTVSREIAGDALLLFHLEPDGRLSAASALGPLSAVSKDMKIAERLIAARAVPDPAALAKGRLKGLLAAA